MHFNRVVTLAALLVAGNFSGAVQAQPTAAPTPWEAGKNYFIIDPPQPTSSGDKVEVTEVFSYGCPGCNYAHTYIDQLKKHLPPNAVLDYVPASFNPSEDWVMFQRAFYTAKALDLVEKTHDAMFDAVWKSGELAIYDKGTNRVKQPLPSIEDAAKFYAKFGVSAADFIATANSFSINTRMKQADAYVKACGVDVTPTIIVNGKYRLTAASAGGDWGKTEQLVLYLVHLESSTK